MSDSESIWEYFGENDPYFAVNTISEMRSDTLDGDKIKLFFERGEDYIKRIWQDIETHFAPDFQPNRSLDFGCGVARMTLPIARRSKEAVGVDISTSMLKVAEKNADMFGVKNVSFVKSDDTISKVTGKFDFVHSIVVFQHIKPKIGEVIFRRMVEMLSEGGIGALHVTYANSLSTKAQKIKFTLSRDFPLVYKLRNFVLRKKAEPMIPIYLYDLNRLMLILQQNDCHNCQIRFSQHGFDGVVIFFQKKKDDLY
jgi:SAM-dependent methyltransferase